MGGSNSTYIMGMALYNNTTRVVGVADSGNGTNLDTSTYIYDRVQLYIQISSGVTCDNLQFKPMIRKASVTDSTFTPYNPIELCKIGNYQDYLYKANGTNLFNKNNASLIVQGKDYNGSGVLESNTNWAVGYVSCEANKTYTISGLKTYNGTSIVNVDSNKENAVVLKARTGATTYTFTTTQNGYIGISYVWNESASQGNEQNTLMLNIGDTALPYEPYGTGWYKKQVIGKKVASEISIYNFNIGEQGLYFNSDFTNVKGNRTLQVYSNTQTWKNSTDTDWNTLNGAYIGVLYNVKQIYINKSASSRTELKAWLDSINFEMRYVLATPQDIEITDTTLINQLNNIDFNSYNPVTNISTDKGLMIIYAEALGNIN